MLFFRRFNSLHSALFVEWCKNLVVMSSFRRETEDVKTTKMMNNKTTRFYLKIICLSTIHIHSGKKMKLLKCISIWNHFRYFMHIWNTFANSTKWARSCTHTYKRVDCIRFYLLMLNCMYFCSGSVFVCSLMKWAARYVDKFLNLHFSYNLLFAVPFASFICQSTLVTQFKYQMPNSHVHSIDRARSCYLTTLFFSRWNTSETNREMTVICRENAHARIRILSYNSQNYEQLAIFCKNLECDLFVMDKFHES